MKHNSILVFRLKKVQTLAQLTTRGKVFSQLGTIVELAAPVSILPIKNSPLAKYFRSHQFFFNWIFFYFSGRGGSRGGRGTPRGGGMKIDFSSGGGNKKTFDD